MRFSPDSGQTWILTTLFCKNITLKFLVDWATETICRYLTNPGFIGLDSFHRGHSAYFLPCRSCSLMALVTSAAPPLHRAVPMLPGLTEASWARFLCNRKGRYLPLLGCSVRLNSLKMPSDLAGPMPFPMEQGRMAVDSFSDSAGRTTAKKFPPCRSCDPLGAVARGLSASSITPNIAALRSWPRRLSTI